jgi:DNA polymerase IIIc chi subunit
VARPFVRDDVQKNLIAYAQSVIDDEWPVMAHGRAHPQTERLYSRLWALTYHFEP